MSIVLIDARHYGEQFRNARKMLNMKSSVAAKLLKISVHELHRYECGVRPMPAEMLFVLFHRGLALSACRIYNLKKSDK